MNELRKTATAPTTPLTVSCPLPPGVHVFERGWLSANNILFTGATLTAMVDSGYCTHAAQTLALVEAALGSQSLDLLINTHLHSDHCGGNAALQARYPGIQTLIPPGHAEQVADWDANALTYLPTGQQCPRFRYDQTLQAGSQIQLGLAKWTVYSAAGHDPHSLILFEPISKTLLSADALWENGFGVVFPELEGLHAFTEVRDTLDLIETLAPKVVIPGHGPVFNYVPSVLTRARERLAYFVENPRKHALHGAKVLLKFKLLEVQRQALQAFVNWAMTVPYLCAIHRREAGSTALQTWIEQLCDDLVKAGAAAVDGMDISNA